MSTINSHNYNSKTKTLQLVFTYDVDRTYTYTGVSVQRYSRFKRATSQGSYFMKNIRDKYPTTCERN
jgi:hypothetical protein